MPLRAEGDRDSRAVHPAGPAGSGAILKTVGASRFDLKYAMGGLADDKLLTTIRLYGEEVVPRVRELLG